MTKVDEPTDSERYESLSALTCGNIGALGRVPLGVDGCKNCARVHSASQFRDNMASSRVKRSLILNAQRVKPQQLKRRSETWDKQ